MNKRDVIEQIILEHWVEKWDDRKHATAVKCCYPGCDWRGRFPRLGEHTGPPRGPRTQARACATTLRSATSAS